MDGRTGKLQKQWCDFTVFGQPKPTGMCFRATVSQVEILVD